MALARARFDGLADEVSTVGASRGTMFGKPCLKIGTKAFACQFRDGVAFKLPGSARDAAMALAGSVLFDPSGAGRPMKEWAQVPVDHAERWSTFAVEALRYVRG